MSHNALPITFSTHPDTVGLLRHESGAVSLSAARHRACLEAAWEIEALARLLPDLALRDDDALPLQVRGVARRLGDLAGAVMSGLDDGVVVDLAVGRSVTGRAISVGAEEVV